MTKVLTSSEIEEFKNRFMFDDKINILSIRTKSIGKNQTKYIIIIDDQNANHEKSKQMRKPRKEKKEKKSLPEPTKEKIVIPPRDPIPPPRPPMAEITSLGSI